MHHSCTTHLPRMVFPLRSEHVGAWPLFVHGGPKFDQPEIRPNMSAQGSDFDAVPFCPARVLDTKPVFQVVYRLRRMRSGTSSSASRLKPRLEKTEWLSSPSLGRLWLKADSLPEAHARKKGGCVKAMGSSPSCLQAPRGAKGGKPTFVDMKRSNNLARIRFW